MMTMIYLGQIKINVNYDNQAEIGTCYIRVVDGDIVIIYRP